MVRKVTRAGLLGIAWLLTASWVMAADTAADKLGARLAELFLSAGQDNRGASGTRA